MKRALLLIVAPVLLVALAFAQTPASMNTDQIIKGCLSGSEGNYTVTQNNTGHVFKIATSSVDLKPHVGHDVTLTVHSASGESSGAAENSLAITELSMTSEHCAGAAAAPVATVSTLSETAIPPPQAGTPAAPVAETAVAPTQATTAPAATTTPVAEIAVAPSEPITPSAAVTPPESATPPSVGSSPAETVVTPSGEVSTPAAARPHRLPAASAAAAATPDVTSNSSSEPASTPGAAAATPIATPSTASEPVTTPAADATTPAAPANHGSLYLLIAFAVFVIVLGVLVPSISRWRKQKSLEQTGAPNLSFTREAPAEQEKVDAQEPRKAA